VNVILAAELNRNPRVSNPVYDGYIIARQRAGRKRVDVILARIFGGYSRICNPINERKVVAWDTCTCGVFMVPASVLSCNSWGSYPVNEGDVVAGNPAGEGRMDVIAARIFHRGAGDTYSVDDGDGIRGNPGCGG
jgi:hypothetical protein